MLQHIVSVRSLDDLVMRRLVSEATSGDVDGARRIPRRAIIVGRSSRRMSNFINFL